jgi:hypothetical protein
MILLPVLRRRTLRRQALLVVLVLVCNAVGPALGQSVAQAIGATPGRLVEMCTSLGMQQVFVPDGGGEADPARLLAFKHCPFCLGGEPLPPLPVVRQALPGGPAMEPPVHQPDRAAPAPSYRLCSPTPPRGPPPAA